MSVQVRMASARQLHRNILIEMVFGFVMYLNLLQPLLQKYYTHNGLSQFTISCLLSLHTAMVLVLDTPTGYIGDRCGYRLVRQVGAVPLSLGFLILYYSHALPAIICGVVLWGVGSSCMRGASDAHAKLSVERLPDARKGYERFTHYSLSFMAAGEAIGALAAWMVLTRVGTDGDPRIVALWQCIIFFSPIVLLQCMKEQHAGEGPVPSIATRLRLMSNLVIGGWRNMSQRTRAVLSVPILRDALIFAAVLSASTNSAVGISLAYFEAAGLTTLEVPLVWAAHHAWWAITPFLVVSYGERLGKWQALATVPVICFVLYCAVAASSYAVGLWLFAGFMFVRTVHLAIMRNYIAMIAPPEQRGLVASMVSTAQLALSMVMNVMLGLVIHYGSVRLACVVAAVIYLPTGLVCAFRMRTYYPAADTLLDV